MKLGTQYIALIAAMLAVTMLGAIGLNYYLLGTALEDRQQAWAGKLAHALSEGLARDIIEQRQLRLREVLVRIAEEDDAVHYAFVTDFDGKVLAHSFRDGFPKALLPAADSQSTMAERHAQEVDGVSVVEVAFPVVPSMRARLHLGINEQDNARMLARLSALFALLVLGVGFAGMAVSAWLGRRIARPLQQLSENIERYGATGVAPAIINARNCSEVRQLQASFQDMMAMREADAAALGRNFGQLKEAQRIAQLGSWELDLGSGRLSWSDEIFRLFEIDQTQFGATYEAFLNAIHPEDREAVNQAYSQSLADRQPYEVTHRLLMADGCIKWVHERCTSEFAADGRALRSSGTVQDITRQRQAELALTQLNQELEQRVAERTQALSEANEQAFQANRMLYTVLDTIPVRIFWKDRNLAYLGCNRLFAQDAGKARPEDIIGRTDQELSWHTVAEQYQADDAQIISSGEARLGYEEPQTTAEGKVLWLRTSKVPLRNAAGETIGVLGTDEDITDKKNIESELRSAKEAAETANRAKSLFLSSMSHELRTPLNAILGYSQLLERNTELAPEVTESAGEIRQAGQHLLALVNDILDLARVESGHLEFHLEGLVLGEVVADCLSQNQLRAAESGVALIASDLCRTLAVRADRRRLLQVLNNLVSNAIKYNRRGGQVSLSCRQPALGWCRIEVGDTGAGLTAAQLSQLFQPFNRVGAEMSQIEGTGIGLTITKQLVEGMGGAIGVDSTPGTGSTFWVELPLADIAPVVAPARPVLMPVSAAARNAGALAALPPRVLVAEDYGPNQTILRLQLESLGCVVDMTGDGAQALARWRQARHNLILTDLNMPVMDGLALARAVRQIERETGGHTPIIAITAAAEKSELKRCRDVGMDDVLTKPIALDGLWAVLARWAVGGLAQAAPSPAPDVSPLSPAGPLGVFDLTALYRVLGQVNPAQARELVDAFIESAGEGLAALARQPDDAQALAREMHKQKSSARTVGALDYACLAEALEHAASQPGLDAPGRLAELQQALVAVRQATRQLEVPGGAGPAAEVPEVLPELQCNSVLVVDDDVVVLKQMQPMLKSLGVAEVLTAVNGVAAIATLSARATELEVVVCDLNMPEMDGVELIRRFGQAGFKGALILMSGAAPQILNTARQLAEMQGLRVLGLINKPVLPRAMAELLTHAREQAPARRGVARAAAQISVADVREAMARDEFTVWFQPKVDTLSLRPTGLEALARWRRADGSFVSPDQFILLAEREGLIGELSHVLVARALREAARVHQAGFSLKLAVNLSGLWLDDLNLPDIILSMAREAGIQPRDLVLEVTETGVMEDLTTALDVLTRLRLKGFGLSIDDFGIGYSSFEQLGRIPFTEMKLDRSFVNKGRTDPAARAILESSMGMAQKLGLVTVAEGVETTGELALVRELGCDNVQGYLVAKPMPVDDLIVWLGQPVKAL